ncbi:hypothetical protein Q7P35_005185 [Cladosporium inversicolor]
MTQIDARIIMDFRDPAVMPSQTNNDQFKLSNIFDVKGRVALVTGGGSGIGLMVTQALTEKLDRVVKSHGKDVVGEIIPLTADISNKHAIRSLFDKVSKCEQHLDVLMNNAGITTGKTNKKAGSAQQLKEAVFDEESATFEYQNISPAW